VAKSRFQRYVQLQTTDSPDRQRALRFVSRPDLARARMAPPFEITAADGQRISVDNLQGKVVLKFLIFLRLMWMASCRMSTSGMHPLRGS
jgi:hypothetical protein